MFEKGMSYRFKKFIQRFMAAIAAIIFISSDFLIPAASQAFVPAAAPGLLPIISDVILFGTAAELATIAAPIIVGGFVIGAAYYYWSQEQTEQAQIKAEEKYCSANPSEQLCDIPPPFTGGQSPGVLYAFTTNSGFYTQGGGRGLVGGTLGPIYSRSEITDIYGGKH